MPSTFYLRDDILETGYTELSTDTAAKTAADAGNLRFMQGEKGSTLNTFSAITNNSTNNEQWFHRAHITRPLQAQSISAANWIIETAPLESNAGLNHFARYFCYVRRGGANVATIFGPVSEATEDSTTAYIGRQHTVAGAAVTLQAGDQIVLEIWSTGTASMTTSWTEKFDYNGTQDISDEVSTLTSPAPALIAPQDIIEFFPPGLPTDTQPVVPAYQGFRYSRQFFIGPMTREEVSPPPAPFVPTETAQQPRKIRRQQPDNTQNLLPLTEVALLPPGIPSYTYSPRPPKVQQPYLTQNLLPLTALPNGIGLYPIRFQQRHTQQPYNVPNLLPLNEVVSIPSVTIRDYQRPVSRRQQLEYLPNLLPLTEVIPEVDIPGQVYNDQLIQTYPPIVFDSPNTTIILSEPVVEVPFTTRIDGVPPRPERLPLFDVQNPLLLYPPVGIPHLSQPQEKIWRPIDTNIPNLLQTTLAEAEAQPVGAQVQPVLLLRISRPDSTWLQSPFPPPTVEALPVGVQLVPSRLPIGTRPDSTWLQEPLPILTPPEAIASKPEFPSTTLSRPFPDVLRTWLQQTRLELLPIGSQNLPDIAKGRVYPDGLRTWLQESLPIAPSLPPGIQSQPESVRGDTIPDLLRTWLNPLNFAILPIPPIAGRELPATINLRPIRLELYTWFNEPLPKLFEIPVEVPGEQLFPDIIERIISRVSQLGYTNTAFIPGIIPSPAGPPGPYIPPGFPSGPPPPPIGYTIGPSLPPGSSIGPPAPPTGHAVGPPTIRNVGSRAGQRYINLIQNPGVEQSLEGWVAAQVSAMVPTGNSPPTIVRTDEDARIGQYSALVTVTSNDLFDAVQWYNHDGSKIRVTGGAQYTLIIPVKPKDIGGASILGHAQVAWYNASDTFISQTAGTLHVINPGDPWSNKRTVHTAPANAVYAVPCFEETVGWDVGESVYFDMPVFVQGNITVQPFDGDTPGARWLGTPYRSSSEIVPSTPQQPYMTRIR